MKIQDISVRKRLLVSNFIMVCVPVFLFLLLGGLILVGLRLTGNARQREMEVLWPEGGTALSMQIALTSLREQVDRRQGPKPDKIVELTQALEAQGMQVGIFNQDSLFYESPGSSAVAVAAEVKRRYGGDGPVFLWNEEGLLYRDKSPRSGTVIVAAGHRPIFDKNGTPGLVKDVVETTSLIFVGLSVLIITITGLFLSRRLSEQIVKPLENLRHAAGEISRGNLDYTLYSDARDELGDTCQEFNRMREQLKMARETREKYEMNRKELIAGISHDLSTPLTSVKGYTSGLIDGIAKTPEKKAHYLQMIYQTASSMENLVDSLFLFSKLDLGRMPFQWETVCLDSYLDDYVTENKSLLTRRGLLVSYKGLGQTCMVSMDRIQFQRVIENLLGNSLKYKQRDEAHVVISLQRQREQVRLCVADDGSGVADADLPKLFDSFYRTDPALTNVAKGCGLGLAIVKQIIQAMGGTIWAEHAPAGGLAVCITLPVLKEEVK